MPDWDELSSGGGEMDELARAAAGVACPPTLSPFSAGDLAVAKDDL